MFSTLADRLLSAILPTVDASAPCGATTYSFCYCRNGYRYIRSYRDCTGAGGGYSACYVSGRC